MDILIIDDHQLFAAGLKHMLASTFNNARIQCFSNPTKAIEHYDDNNIDIVIIDFYIPGFDTLKSIADFSAKKSHPFIVVISSSVSVTDRKDCLAAGAKAYFEKHLPPDLFLSQLKKLLNNDVIEDEALPFVERENKHYGLSSKKSEILVLLARGYSNKKIANRLNISAETVKTHIAEIYRELNISSRDQATEWACQHGFV